MKVRIINDGKGKAQSYKANVSIRFINFCGNYNAEIEAYGDNESIAKQNFIEQVDRMILELNKLKEEAKNYKNE